MSARVLGDVVNTTFAREPATTPWCVTRAELEKTLVVDPRFRLVDGLWHLTDGDAGIARNADATPLAIEPLRAGAAPALHPWQREALASWEAADRRGIVEAVTGSGKTRVGEAAIASHLRRSTNRAVVIVPTIDLANQWLRTLHARFAVPVAIVGDGSAADFERTSILVYVARSAVDDLPAKMRRMPASRAVLLVADECHRYGSESYARALDAPFAATLGLSATPERAYDDGMASFVIPRLGPVVYAYDHERGIADDVISDFRLDLVGVDFAPSELAEHDELSRKLTTTRRSLLSTYPFLAGIEPFVGAVRQLADRDEEGTARYFLSLTMERRRLLSGAKARHEFVRWLAAHRAFDGRRTLLFHETIADCAHLAAVLTSEGIAAAAHHSGLDRDARRATLAAFARGDLSAIAAPRTLDEGVDVPDASLAVIVAGTRQKRQAIQRIGRVLRRAPNKCDAKVVKVFVNHATDDPTTSNASPFMRDMMTSRRAALHRWPHDAAEILDFIAG